MSNYQVFLKIDREFHPSGDAESSAKLPPGSYFLNFNPENGKMWFTQFDVRGDDLVDLPGTAYDLVIQDLQMFLTTECKYRHDDVRLIHKMNILLYGPPGCHAKGTEILMYNGSIKRVEDVVVGDELMGPDSQPRKVLALAGGREKMVKIKPTKGEEFVVNYNHILHLTPSGKNNAFKSPVNIKFSDFINNSKPIQEKLKLTRIGVEFNNNETLEIPPYILGAWLGDGTTRAPNITSMDSEIVKTFDDFAKSLDLKLKMGNYKQKSAAKVYYVTGSKGNMKNDFLNALRKLNVLNNKHIPLKYLTSSKENRLQLLAGLIDTDGSLSCNGYDFVSISKEIADGVIYLARSLGLSAYIKPVKKSCLYKGERKYGNYFRISITGNTDMIPCKLPRKQAKPRKQIKDVLRTGFTYEILPEDNYYGFSLDKDHLYLTSDFTIHHNTGKSCIVNRVAKEVISNNGIVLFNPHPQLLKDVYALFDKLQPETRILIIFEELDQLIEQHDEGAFLHILDGELQKPNVLFIATTNYIAEIPMRIRRPGRFALRQYVGFPNAEARFAYLNNKLKDVALAKGVTNITAGFSIDNLKEVVRATYCMKKDLNAVVNGLRNEFNIDVDGPVDPASLSDDGTETLKKKKPTRW